MRLLNKEEATQIIGLTMAVASPICFNPTAGTLKDSVEMANLQRSLAALDFDESSLNGKAILDRTFGQFQPMEESFAKILEFKTAGALSTNHWRDLPKLSAYVDMDDLNDAEAAEEAVLQAMRKQGW